ncbi:Os01g0141100 [Oryza sativa Japonica Group]|uniref:Os01g0141100 protein n=1 Tax=Oryza sativa subsp. japonica TaxID=39947 RepID=A0A0P0UY01_ORYSJ|nr:hypothetical protein EE612_000192 [Oryza sativa]BAS70318.1 Os01g0141100 [Oryza sativa Japonica Group]
MYSNFKEQAIEYVKQAVQEDNAGNYVKAFPLYMNALEYFKTHLKYEKNPKIKEAITAKFTEYLRRAEEIRAVLDEGGGGGGANGGDAAVATRPKTKGKDGEGGGDDSEQSKLRAGLNSAIITEKPNIKWNDVAGLESAKQALQEAVILPVKFPQFFCMVHQEQESLIWLKLLQLRLILHFSVYLHQTLFQNGWERVKNLLQTFSKWLEKTLLPLSSLMKLIHCVVNEEKEMRVKLLGESKLNFLCKCRVLAIMMTKYWFLLLQTRHML